MIGTHLYACLVGADDEAGAREGQWRLQVADGLLHRRAAAGAYGGSAGNVDSECIAKANPPFMVRAGSDRTRSEKGDAV